MSSNKKATTVGLDREIMERLCEEAKREKRSRSFIVELALAEHFNQRMGKAEEKQDAK
jgi:predicted transcriptional regulator